MKSKIIVIIVSIMILSIAICYMIYSFIDAENERKEDLIALTLKENLSVEFLGKVKVSDFIESLNGKLISDDYIDTTTLGEKEVTFNYISQRNKEKTRSFKINIIDTVKPMIYMSGTLTVPKGYDKELIYAFLSGDNADPNPTRKIIGEYDTNKVRKIQLRTSA